MLSKISKSKKIFSALVIIIISIFVMFIAIAHDLTMWLVILFTVITVIISILLVHIFFLIVFFATGIKSNSLSLGSLYATNIESLKSSEFINCKFFESHIIFNTYSGIITKIKKSEIKEIKRLTLNDFINKKNEILFFSELTKDVIKNINEIPTDFLSVYSIIQINWNEDNQKNYIYFGFVNYLNQYHYRQNDFENWWVKLKKFCLITSDL